MSSEAVELTQQQIEEMRDRAMRVLVANQEVFVAQWIMQNPFAKISDYELKFYQDDPECVYSVRMEKINVQ